TGAHDLTLSAKSEDEMSTEAESGSAGSIGLTPVVAVSISNVTTRAGLSSAASALNLGGKLDATADQTAKVETQATGDSAGTSAAVGASVAVNSVDHEAIA